jgi:hypothetical protein
LPDLFQPARMEAGARRCRCASNTGQRHARATPYLWSVLLEDGVSIKALAEYLGHADPGFTLRTYTHLMPSSEDRAWTVMLGTVYALMIVPCRSEDVLYDPISTKYQFRDLIARRISTLEMVTDVANTAKCWILLQVGTS